MNLLIFQGRSDPELMMSRWEQLPNWRDNPFVARIFERDVTALKASDALLLVLPAGKSAHIEAGIAYGLGKPCFALGEQHETESLYQIFREIFPSLNAFTQYLSETTNSSRVGHTSSHPNELLSNPPG